MFDLIDIHIEWILPVVYSSKLVWHLKKYKISGQFTNKPIILVDLCNTMHRDIQSRSILLEY